MAIIVEQHVVADQYEISDTTITAGMAVKLDSDGKAVRNTDVENACIGLAGDSKLEAEGQTTAYGAKVYVGVQDPDALTHNTRWTSNRISDFYDETLASGKITVYNGGGKFWISSDIWTNPDTAAPGYIVVPAAGGQLTASNSWADGKVIGKIVGEAQKVASGVPGTDIDGSMSLNAGTTQEWVPIILSV